MDLWVLLMRHIGTNRTDDTDQRPGAKLVLGAAGGQREFMWEQSSVCEHKSCSQCKLCADDAAASRQRDDKAPQGAKNTKRKTNISNKNFKRAEMFPLIISSKEEVQIVWQTPGYSILFPWR